MTLKLGTKLYFLGYKYPQDSMEWNPQSMTFLNTWPTSTIHNIISWRIHEVQVLKKTTHISIIHWLRHFIKHLTCISLYMNGDFTLTYYNDTFFLPIGILSNTWGAYFSYTIINASNCHGCINKLANLKGLLWLLCKSSYTRVNHWNM